MVTQNTNPFVLPGFGQTGDLASNPMLASIEMMRQAWEGLATASGFDASQTVPGSTPEDLERRIKDLRAVENWLRMNLSMLGSTIQALEVQRSTLATLQAFVASAGGGAGTDTVTPSPLDVALGIHRGASAAPSADTSGLFGGSDTASSAAAGQAGAGTAAASPESGASSGKPDQSASAPSQADTESAPAGAADAVMKSWWDMLQNQFDNLASATAAGIQGAEAIKEAATEAQKHAVESTRAAAETLKKSTDASAPQPAKKAAAKKAAAKKAAARKSTATKSAAKKTTAKKAVAKKSAAKKTAAKKSATRTSTAKKAAARKTVSKTADATSAVGTTKVAVKSAATKTTNKNDGK